MKKVLAFLIIVSLVVCSTSGSFAEGTSLPAGSVPEAGFSGMNDPNLLRYTEDTIYENLVTALDSEEYFVENVSTIYISQEYIDELAYNSQANIYFGYTLQELAEQFQGKKYVFTLGDDGSTIVTEFEDYDDTYDRALKNVAIGTGVLLICVTVSVVTAGAGAPAVSMIFAASAKTGTIMALSGGAMGGISAGIVTGMQTGDMDEALKAAALAGSEGYKWGAISGAVSGAVGETITLKGATMHGLTMNEAAEIQRESKYPLDLIKEFHSYDEYLVYYRDAGLRVKTVCGRTALVPDGLDPDYISELADGRKVSNLTRMLEGYAPLDPLTGKAYQLHHVGQRVNGTLAVLTEAQHQGNAAILNMVGKASEINRTAFSTTRKEFWMSFGKILANS